MKQLEEETGMTLRKFEVWYNDDNLRLLQRLDKDGVCNGVPFFYSKIKRDWICGATIYPNFKAWALGKPHERFLSPPTDDSEVMGQFKGFFDRIKSTGFEAMRKRVEAGKKLAGDDVKSTTGTTPRGKRDKGAFASYQGVLLPKTTTAVCARRNNSPSL